VIGINDPIRLIEKHNNEVTIKYIIEQLVTKDKENIILMEKAVKVKGLPQGWKHYFLEKLSQLNK
jgi:hypothetical protein